MRGRRSGTMRAVRSPPSQARLSSLALALTAAAAALAGCTDRAPEGLRATPPGDGAVIRYDLGHLPLPEVPLPSDVATYPDPTSRTGLRVNASMIAPTAFESRLREGFTDMEGWGTFAPITLAFDKTEGVHDPSEAALDLDALARRHRGDDYAPHDDAVYLIDLSTGVPVPLDLGEGNYPLTLRDLDRYWPNDPRATERNLLFETFDETRGGAIDLASFGPEHDSDRDGVLDVPNLDDPRACPGADAVCDAPSDPSYGSPECVAKRRSRDRCMADHLLHHYERETDTLVLRPLVPLDEMTRYAVVITDRLVDSNQEPVRSPFPFVYHAAQEAHAARVRDALNDPSRAAYFGDLAGTGLDHVAFTWTFTTQPTVDDMVKLRDGLYERGPFAHVGASFEPTLELVRAVGLTGGLATGAQESPGWADSEQGELSGCPAQAGNLYVVKYEELARIMEDILVSGFGTSDGPDTQLLLKNLEHVDHLVIGTFKAPYYLEGGEAGVDPMARFRLDYQTGAGEVHEGLVQVFMVVPRETAEHQQPFDVNIYGTGHTGNFVTEQFLYAGLMAKHGLATVGVNPVGHGLVLDDPTFQLLGSALFAGGCVAPFFDAIQLSRARDLNGDGTADSGGDFWTAYLFHLRDMVRQSVLDQVALVRILRGFGAGARMTCRTDDTGWASPADGAPCDVDGDGTPEVAGDFDGDGTPDLGGPGARFHVWGQSLGGTLAPILGAVDDAVTTSVPTSGGGGLTDVGVRSVQGSVLAPVLLRIMGPLVVALPAEERPACADDPLRAGCTSCAAGEVSLRWVVPDVTDDAELEIACFSAGELEDTTVFVANLDTGETSCSSVEADLRMRVHVGASLGDTVQIYVYDGAHRVESYGTCRPTFGETESPLAVVTSFGKGGLPEGSVDEATGAICEAPSCQLFQGAMLGEGWLLVAPAEGLGFARQTPSFRRMYGIGQAAVDPGDPINFAARYFLKAMPGVGGEPRAPHAMLVMNTVGDMNVPLTVGISLARAQGAVPFLRPEHALALPEWAEYATPPELYAALGGKTPNQVLLERWVTEGSAPLARTPAGAACEASQNAAFPDGTFETPGGQTRACFPTGCATQGAACLGGSSCDQALDQCVPQPLGRERCEEALFDVEDLDEGAMRMFEQAASVPLRLGRYARRGGPGRASEVWAPRLFGQPYGVDGAFTPEAGRPLAGLLNAYLVPEGEHTFVNGNPCQAFDVNTYLTNVVGTYFASDGTDLVYLSRPATHRALSRE